MQYSIHFSLTGIVGIVLLLWGVPTQAQVKGTITGRVMDSTSRNPVEYGSVALFATGGTSIISGSVTNADGYFELNDIAAGNYYLEVRFIGYETSTIPNLQITREVARIDLGNLLLAMGAEVLSEVNVSGTRSTFRHTIDKQIYRADQFQTAVGGSAVDVLRNMPSVSVNSDGEILMRGASGFLVLLDGRPVMGDAASFLNQLAANAIEEIEIVTSPSAHYDPDGKSGIINIKTKKGNTDSVYLLVNAQLGAPSIETFGNKKLARRFGGDITSNIRRGKWDISLGVDYKRNDIAGYRDGEVRTIRNGIVTSLPSLGERSYRRESYSARVSASYVIDKSNTLSASAFGGKKSELRTADLLYKQTRSRSDDQTPYETLAYFNKNLRERRGDFFIAGLDYQHTFSNKATTTISALYEHTELGGPTNNLNVHPTNHSDTLDHHIMKEYNPLDGFRMNLAYELPLSEEASFQAGYQYRYLTHLGQFSYNTKVLGTPDFITRPEYGGNIDLRRSIHSVYTQYNKKVERWTYNVGLRLEHTDRTLEEESGRRYFFNQWNLFPSLNAMYDAGNGYELKAGYNRRIERTTTSMMNPFMARRHSEVLEEGDPELLPELIDVAELGVVRTFGQNSVSVNAFYRHTGNAISRVNSVHNDSTLYRTYTNARSSQAYGVEAGVEVKPTKWWKIYTGGVLYQFSVDGRIFERDLKRSSVNYSFNLNSTFNITSTLTTQINLNYLSRSATVQGEDSRFFSPNLTVRKSVFKNRGAFTLQWAHIGLGLFETNRQRRTTRGDDFYASTDYIAEVDIVTLNFTYRINELGRVLKFSKSEFGEKEF